MPIRNPGELVKRIGTTQIVPHEPAHLQWSRAPRKPTLGLTPPRKKERVHSRVRLAIPTIAPLAAPVALQALCAVTRRGLSRIRLTLEARQNKAYASSLKDPTAGRHSVRCRSLVYMLFNYPPTALDPSRQRTAATGGPR